MLRAFLAFVIAVATPVAVQSRAAIAVEEETGFGSNPGGLQMFRYAPVGLPAGAPLVVAMHACSQTASQYGDESGWLQLAERWRFALLLPQKPHRGCFSWYEPAHNARGAGEALSAKQMVDRMLARYGGDPRRVHVTGLSSGGAMSAVMAAAYPEVFAGAGIVAGLPYRCAGSLIQAYRCMSPGENRSPTAWGELVRRASGHGGPWPRISLWQGTSDTIVAEANLIELVEQWTNVHGVDQTPEVTETVAGHPRLGYAGPDQRVVVETYVIAGMAHGQPVAPGTEQCGRTGPFALDRGICAASHIGRFFGLNATS